MGNGVRVAVVGHVEWVQFARVDALPAAGDIVHADPLLAVPAGGGAVAAVFHRLDTLEPGQEIRVARTDGTVAEFTVEDVRAAGVRLLAGAPTLAAIGPIKKLPPLERVAAALKAA